MTTCQKRIDWQLLLCLCESISYVSREMIDSSFYAYMNQSFFIKSCESVFLFLFYSCKIWTNWCSLLVVNSHFFFVCIATIKLLKSFWFFQIILWNTLHWKCLPLMAMTKLFVKIMEHKLQEILLRFTKRVVQLEHFIILNVPTSPQVLSLLSIFILQRSIAYPSERKITSVNVVNKFFCCFYSLRLHWQKVRNGQKCIGGQKCGCDTVSGTDWRWELGGIFGNVLAVSCRLWHGEWETWSVEFCHGDIGCTHFEP